MNPKFKTPILLLIFNRPDFSAQLLRQLGIIQPQKLYIVFDGPRNEYERDLIEESKTIFKTVGWECDLKYNFSDQNMGIKNRIISGIDWAFSYEEQLIILEDDCIPHTDFFPYCEAMLEKYKWNDRIMSINGCNLNPDLTLNVNETYLFSRYANSWGWATWRRAWQYFDRDLIKLDNIEFNKILKSHLTSPKRATIYWKYKLNEVKANRINSWAFRWMFTLFINKGLAIVPRTNLINNIGNDRRSTNTRGKLHFLNIKTSALSITDIIDPVNIIPNNYYDRWLENSIYSKSIYFRLKWIIKKILFQI
jgi:hypothetical protein